MATQTLTRRRPDASVAAAVPLEVLAGGKAKTPAILALDPASAPAGPCAAAMAPSPAASDAVPPRPVRGRRDDLGPRFRAWLREIDETAGGVGVVLFEEVTAASRRPTAGTRVTAATSRTSTAWAEANTHPLPGRAGRHDQAARHRQGATPTRQAVIAAVARRSASAPADDNEADALALLHWAMAQGIGGARCSATKSGSASRSRTAGMSAAIPVR